MMSVLGAARSFLARRRPTPIARDAIAQDVFDGHLFSDMLQQAPRLQKMTHALSESAPEMMTAPTDLVGDVFAQLFQHAPKLRAIDEMAPDHLVNQMVMTELAEHPEMRKLRELSRNDEYISAMSAASMSQPLVEVLERRKEEREEAMQRALEAQQAAQAAQAARDALQKAVDDGDEDAIAQLMAGAQAADDAASAAHGAAVDAAQGLADAAGAGMAASIKDAANEAQEQNDLFNAFGRGKGSSTDRMSFAERQALAEKLSASRMSEFVKLIGRWRIQAAAQRVRRTQYGRDVVVGVELGRDLTRVLPVEFVRARMHPALKARFGRDLLNGQLLCRKYEGIERVGMGPIVICIDTSYSMNAQVGKATREAWAKAVAIALLDQAREGDRDAHVILFDDGLDSEYEFPRGGDNFATLLEMCEQFSGGGTSFQPPLARALEVILEKFNHDKRPKADVVFITDGDGHVEDGFAEQWHEERDRIGFRCFGVSVTGDGYGRSSTLDALCTNVRVINDLNDTSVLSDVLATV